MYGWGLNGEELSLRLEDGISERSRRPKALKWSIPVAPVLVRCRSMIIALSRRHAAVRKQVRSCLLPEEMYCQLERQRRRDLVRANGVGVHLSLIAKIGLLGRQSESELMNENKRGERG